VTDVTVIGGGIIGLACAWRAAQRGASVVVRDPTPGAGASHAAAGMLCPVTEVHYGEQQLLGLNLESARRWPSFAAELGEASGIDVGYRAEGTVAVAFDDDDLRALDELLRFQQTLGLGVERLRARDCRSLEPQLSPRVRGGLLVPGDHQVDNRRVVAALLVACERAGVRVARRSVDDIEQLASPAVVLAAGCWSGAMAADVPVRPVKGQILRLAFDLAEPPLHRNVRGLAAGRPVYLVPRATGELVVGATVEELGFDTAVTAGAVHELLRAATDLVPGVGELVLVECHAGLRPGTPDNAPVIGRSTHDDRLVHATGHHRNGVLLTPVTADAVAALLTGEEVPVAVAPFGVGRFTRWT
jgi:glycine oxidase